MKQLLEFYKSPLSNSIKKIAAPLEDCFGIDAFAYSRVSPTGQFYQITNQPEASECYISSNLYKSNPFFHHPDNYHPCNVLFSTIHDEKLSRDQAVMGEKFGYRVDSILIMYKKQGRVGHVFSFTTKNTNISTTSIYLNNIPLLDKFCHYFLAEWKDNLKKIDPFSFNIAEIIGKKKFYNHPFMSQMEGEITKRELFLKRLGLYDENAMDSINFSAREQECLELLSEGKTLKQIADLLDLSPRTVQHYFENIKNKIGCNTKSKLLGRAQELKLLGLL